jgi:hypothetical protein
MARGESGFVVEPTLDGPTRGEDCGTGRGWICSGNHSRTIPVPSPRGQRLLARGAGPTT